MSHEVPRRLLAMDIGEEQLRGVPKPAFVNVVATFNMTNAHINTELLTLRMPGFCYNPQRFAACKMRLPRAMILAFCGGIAVCPGSRNVEAARISALRFIDIQLRAGVLVQYSRFRVQNIVMSVYVPFEIYLPAITQRYPARTEYKNSKFPGLSFRMGGDTRIVFNIFVTGRVVITGSRCEEHSYKAWWWLYTHVLVEHKLGTAPGTTSSAAFRMAEHRRSDTIAGDCERLSSRYARRTNGPLARSEYAEFIGTPSLLTPVHVPTTPKSVVVPNAPAQRRLTGIALYFERINTTFAGVNHTVQCPFITVEREQLEWFLLLKRLDLHQSPLTAETARQLVQPHIDAGCTSHTADVETMARRYIGQLRRAIGEKVFDLLVGDQAPLVGHTPACPFVTDDNYERHRHALECAMASAVGDESYDELVALFDSHRQASCQLDDEENDLPAIAHTFIAQLHAAAKDFDGGEEKKDEDEMTTPLLTVEDVCDYEALYRLDRLRATSGGDEDVMFTMNDE